MCVAAPGKVVKMEGNTAIVDYNGNLTKANAGVVKVSVGDYVLVHAGLIIQRIGASEAKEMEDLFTMLEDLGNA